MSHYLVGYGVLCTDFWRRRVRPDQIKLLLLGHFLLKSGPTARIIIKSRTRSCASSSKTDLVEQSRIHRHVQMKNEKHTYKRCNSCTLIDCINVQWLLFGGVHRLPHWAVGGSVLACTHRHLGRDFMAEFAVIESSSDKKDVALNSSHNVAGAVRSTSVPPLLE